MFFVQNNIAITARHVVYNKNNVFIKIDSNKKIPVKAKYSNNKDDRMDIAILELSEVYDCKEYLKLNSIEILSESKCNTFGYPISKANDGQEINGVVNVGNITSKSLYDIEVQMIKDPGLSNYRGISGAPIIIDGTVQAILLRKLDGASFGVLKIKSCMSLLDCNNIKYLSNYSDWLNNVIEKSEIENSEIENSGKFNLDRTDLLENLIDFALENSGMIVGEAGVGKSYIINKLKNSLNVKGYPTINIPVEKFITGEDSELRTEFNLCESENLCDRIIKEFKLIGKKGVVIFDTYDSARNEELRKRILNLIRDMINKSKEVCNVIVVCRRYDAELSHNLLEVFPKAHNGLKCRSFEIKEFSDKEVEDAIQQITNKGETFNCLSSDLKKLLKNAFNLWMFGEIWGSEVDITHIQVAKSELDLLEMFWEKKIGDEHKDVNEYVLRKLTSKLVENKTIVIRKADIFEPSIETTWKDLFSKYVMKYADSFKNKISFTHNILFDYSVSKLVLIDKIDEIDEFIKEEKSRVIFLKPSFVYFFDILWKYDVESFWNISLKLFSSEDLPKIIRFFPVNTIINQANSIEDLNFITEKLQENNIYIENLTKCIFQALDSIEYFNDGLWIEFIGKVISTNINDNLLGTFCKGINRITENSFKNKNTTLLKQSNYICIKLFDYIDSHEECTYSEWLKTIQSILLGIVCKTYSINSEESKKRITKIVDVLDSSGTNVSLISIIVKNIDNIFVNDFEFMSYIVKKIFLNRVTNKDKSILGNSNIMCLTSNIQQDYNMCKFEIYSNLNRFIQMNSYNGFRLAIMMLNIIVLKTDDFSELEKITLEILGCKSEIIQDNSHWWANNYLDDEDVGYIAKALLEYFDKVIYEEKNDEFNKLFNIYLNEAKTAYLWNILLKVAAKKPKFFSDKLLDLCICPKVMICFELTYELGEYIKSACREFSSEALLSIENAIINLTNDKENEENNIKDRSQKRLILCLDRDLLRLEESKDMVNKMDNDFCKYENKPLVQFTSSRIERDYSEELKRQKIYTDDNKITQLLNKIDEINYSVINKEADSEQIESLFDFSKELYGFVNTKMEENLKAEILKQISQALITVLKGSSKEFILENYDFYKDVFKNITVSDLFNNADRDFKGLSRGYVQTPKHIAVEVFLILIQLRKDDEIISCFNTLFRHPSESLKCSLICRLADLYNNEEEYMWDKLKEIATGEDSMLKKELFIPLNNLIGDENNENIIEVLSIGYENDDMDFLNSMIQIVLVECFEYEDKWCNNIVNKIIEKPWDYIWTSDKGICAKIFEYIKCNNLNYYSKELVSKILGFISDVLVNLMNKLSSIDISVKQNISEYRKINEILEWILRKIYFESGENDENRKIPSDLKKKYYINVKPILERVINYDDCGDKVIISASTIYDLFNLYIHFFEFEPEYVIKNISILIKKSVKVGYTSDSLAHNKLKELLNRIFADYKEKLKEEEFMNDIFDILDYFIEVGDQNSIHFLWNLFEIYR